jgi:hypothetical protein
LIFRIDRLNGVVTIISDTVDSTEEIEEIKRLYYSMLKATGKVTAKTIVNDTRLDLIKKVLGAHECLNKINFNKKYSKEWLLYLTFKPNKIGK